MPTSLKLFYEPMREPFVVDHIDGAPCVTHARNLALLVRRQLTSGGFSFDPSVVAIEHDEEIRRATHCLPSALANRAARFFDCATNSAHNFSFWRHGFNPCDNGQQ
jgi:hypothetical protein